MMRNVNEVRRAMCRKVIAVMALAAVGWFVSGAKAEINVTGPGNRGRNIAIRGSRPSPFAARPRPFHSNGTFQTLGAETSGNFPLFPNIIHPDPNNPSDMVFLSVSSSNLTVTAGASVAVTVTVIRLGSPRAAYVFMGGIPEGLGIDYEGIGGPMGTATSRTFTVTTTTAVPPGIYEFYVLGLVTGNKWTQRVPVNVTVQAPPTPPPAPANVGTVVIINSNLSVFTPGTYHLEGSLLQVGALFDNENDHIVDSMPVGSNNVAFPRFPRLFGFGNWTIDVGRGYAVKDGVTANLVITAFLDVQRFIAVHLHMNNGIVTPILLAAGDLAADGVVMSTDAFEISLEGVTPTATVPGFIRGVAEGHAMFLSPDASVLWGDGISFTFDLPLFND